jgi:hypothetical protein
MEALGYTEVFKVLDDHGKAIADLQTWVEAHDTESEDEAEDHPETLTDAIARQKEFDRAAENAVGTYTVGVETGLTRRQAVDEIFGVISNCLEELPVIAEHSRERIAVEFYVTLRP